MGCGRVESPRLSESFPSLRVAEAALNGNAPEIALKIASGRLLQDPGSTRAQRIEAEALVALGRSGDAVSLLIQALQQDSRSAEILLDLGRLALTDDPQAAELIFLRVVELDPRNDLALNNLGVARDLQGRHKEAQDAYRQALGVNTTSQAAVANMAKSLIAANRGG